MSKQLCKFDEEDNPLLTFAFLKPFKNLERHCFHHKHNLEMNEMYGLVDTCFKDSDDFLNTGRKVARLLYEKSKHPNIKSGDLCMAYIKGVRVNDGECSAISIVKSESQVPFLEISDKEGDLELTTHNGIYPDKIDKGVLIVNFFKDKGYLVYTFDKSGGETQFWVKDFLGLWKLRDDEYKTRRYAEMCASFAKEGLPEEVDQEERYRIAANASRFLSEKDEFDSQHFEEQVLREPKVIDQFKDYKQGYDDEAGNPIDEEFQIEHKAAKKAVGKFKPTPDFSENSEDIFERGFDSEKGKKFIKVYYDEEV